MNKELEQEAVNWIINTSQHKSVKNGFIAGATSTYVEKQKLEFAIEQLNSVRTYFDVGKLSVKEHTVHIRFTDVLMGKIKELEQKLSEL